MTVATYDRTSLSASTRLPLERSDATDRVHVAARSLLKQIGKAAKVLFIMASFATIAAGVIALKAVLVMSRFNFIGP